jgi:hypothetical protein
MPEASTEPIRVLYVGGYGRSGSTILERMLGQVPGLVPLGEMRHIWIRSFQANQLCSCGVAFLQCPFWTRAVREAFGSESTLDLPRVLGLKRSVDRIKYLPRIMLARQRPGGRYAERLRQYTDVLADLYAAVRHVSGAQLLVDSSKDPSFAWVLSASSRFQLSVVHLVRDSRAVAFSWTRSKRRHDRAGTCLPRFGPATSAWRWNVYNYPFHLLPRAVPYRFLRYEDMLRDPRACIRDVLHFAGVPVRVETLDFFDGDMVDLCPVHTVSGNPVRFSRGRVALRTDDEWRSRMRFRHRWLVGLLTAHLLWKYGYWR